MLYNRLGATSERQRTAVSVVYGIECSVLMELKLADEVGVFNFTFFCCGCVHPLLFGGVVSFSRSGGVVDIGRV